MWSGLRVIVLLVGVSCMLSVPASVQAAESLKDSFEEGKLSELWFADYAPSDRVSFPKGNAPDGRQSLALEVLAGDLDERCKCQRTEIREASEFQPEFGSDLWYRFNLKLTGSGDSSVESRWMLGAWKQEVDGSPFLAMRFEGGVFYITFESAETRVMLASSLFDARAFLQILKGAQGEKFGFLSDRNLYLGDSSINLEHGRAVYLPDPRSGWMDLMLRVKGGLKGDGIIEVYANGNFVVRATGKIGVDAPIGSKQYFRVGHRRDKAATSAVLWLDDFRRGPTRESVE